MISLQLSYYHYRPNTTSRVKTSSDSNAPASFGMRLSPDTYDNFYMYAGYNGKEPDSYIIRNICKRFPGPEKVQILDIAAGDGRNSIPIAQEGYNVDALEISENGQRQIEISAKNASVKSKVKVINKNILDQYMPDPKYNYIFSSHLSMHFNDKEIDTVFKNASSMLKKRGFLTMDFLIRKEGFENLEQTEREEFAGIRNFRKDYVIKTAEKYGLKLIDNSKFSEKGKSRAYYENQKAWGGNVNAFGFHKKVPVELEWFTFEK